MSRPIQITTPLREFKSHEEAVRAVAVFPDQRRMVTASEDMTLHLWDLKTGVVLKKRWHHNGVGRLAVSRDGQLIASGDEGGEVMVWHGETSELLTQPINAHSESIFSLDFIPDGTVLATGSWDGMTKLWDTETWQQQGDPIRCDNAVNCIRYSPSGQLLAIATRNNVEIYNPSSRECVASFKAHTSWNSSLAWTPDGTRLLTSGGNADPTVREWDALSWQQVGIPWTGHTSYIHAIAVNPAGTLVASASDDNYVRLWRLSDRRTIATFNHKSPAACVTFSIDGKHILSGGCDNMISEWILTIMTARIACLDGDLSTAEKLLTQDINTDAYNHTSYAHRSFVLSRQHDCDHALQDAIRSISIQPSLIGYISKGIALCGTGHIQGARAAFDIASTYTHQDSETIHFLLLIKAIALFSADQHEEANLLLKELTTGCPNTDTRACLVVQAYLRVQLGTKALNDTRYNEAADHFTAAINFDAFSSKSDIHEIYEDLVVLFGWNLKSLWLTAHQKCCHALLRAGKLQDAVKSYQHMMFSSDKYTKADCLDWSNGKSGVLMSRRLHFSPALHSAFTEECGTLCSTNGDAALAASKYDKAIDLYSAAIDLDSASDVIFAKRSKAKLSRMLWEDALLDALKVIELNSSSPIGYQLTHAALHGAQRYDEAIEAFKIMLSKLDNSSEAEIRDLRQQYVCPSEVEEAIQRAIWIELEYTPLRLLNTSTGLLCDRAAQINAFKTSPEYKGFLSSTTKHSDLRTECIKDVVATYFRCILLSHRWDETEALLHDIQDKDVRELNGLGGIVKLQSFCKVARDAGYYWAWMDTCCIDKKSNTELQESINSMFIWYHHSALTIVYLSDVPPSSKSGALAKSEWNRRGWTFQEFLASKVILFYQKDWSLYLNDRSSNHKESPAIMKELTDATGIDARALTYFCPGMSDARQRLQWASMRVTTRQEDIAYSLFGIFKVRLPVDYGENKEFALGRLLQDIVAQSGDITALNWVGQSSEFNSCLPADISSYNTPPHTLPSLSEDQIQTAISSLRKNPVVEGLASTLYDRLDDTSAARFANRRLHLPCITFRVTDISLSYGLSQETRYEVKADGLHDLLITTQEPIVQFSRTRPTQQTFVLVRPWDRYHLLELPDVANVPEVGDDTESEEDYWTPPSSPSDESPSRSLEMVDLASPELRLLVRLGRPFSAFLLARQRGREYKRVASDRDIIAQVKDVASVRDLMDIRTIEIL
ncbi:uncharacterized protein HD556DRAFT_1525032 [Suillus plorans]|uniref:Heterokaryon incompatibility domain-containing protein n=1 Tax=Suillus plorans TaxID=116603 RepID=A0A9P7DP81_9AGAM|nr:uncharacterized protein HD556DRAFT_1525032 [Suillus plorans]KAG1799729.1 hypothetical protein HD556DRAFT_1525032 [Suillus plorans]